MARFFLCLLLASVIPLHADVISWPVNSYVGENTPDGIRVLAAFELDDEAEDSTPISGLSALAWDVDNQLLYAVSDRGWLHHLQLRFDSRNRLAEINRLASYQLHDLKGKPLKGKWRDAESAFVLQGDNGIRDDTLIVIGFERSPRIVRYRPDGFQQGRYSLPKQLSKKKKFHKPNDMFEAVAMHEELGVMLIPQKPLMGREINALYRLKGEKQWDYEMESERGNSMAALEALPDGSLVAMERAWDRVFFSLVINLKQIRVDSDRLVVEKIARLSNAEGWILDNFEGLARHQDKRFFIVSDDNQNPLQRTLLYYIELKTR
ncbi:hypothetical protein BOW50_02015 [Solemya velum gill symbiont]|uniref:esterase-like activity of phytase family protein n=1 Tax=Solemya velum gill symbiont TaxID=2340 RepID=UPI0009983C8C|nr:esterase-like activity of phytase family protein [Solemya velum gill symbiont]OOZ80065.1 hypothetical protein BOW50_02015 [Solemya velum gill symbiont]